MKKKALLALLLVALAITNINPAIVKADYDDYPAQKVTKIVAASKTVTVGSKFELNAIVSPLGAEGDNLVWKIVGTKGIVQFEDYDVYDDEVELIAVKAGKTKIRCSVVGKSKSYSKTITITVKKAKKATGKITRVGAKKRVVELGDDFELKVKKDANVKNSHLKWTIKKTSIVRYDEAYDRYGKEAEFEAIKIGTTTITCKNTKTNKKIKYTIQVVPDYDDDWYDDDDDDWDD